MKRLIAALSLVIALTAVVGVVSNLDGRYAKADTVARIEDRLDRKIIEDRMEKLQERMWALEDRWAAKFMAEKNRIHDTLEELLHFMTPEARDHYRSLQKEYAELAEDLKGADDE